MRIKHTCGLLVLSLLYVLLAPFPAQADVDPLEWVSIDSPGLRGNIVVSPSEVSEIAVGRSGTIYAVDSSDNSSKVYRSQNAGATWVDITSHLVSAGAVLPASKIAVAPDATSTVAVVTDNRTEVYLSTNGGDTWTDTNVPSLTGTAIQSITISRQYTEAEESVREVAIGTADWGDNTTTGEVWVLRWGKFVSSWQRQSLTVDPGHGGGEVSAIAYSPSYQRDDTIIVVASTGSDVSATYRNKTWLCIGKRDTAAGTTTWNALIGSAFSDYPVEIATTSSPSAGDADNVSISASLALPSNYSGSNPVSRQLFVSYDRYPENAHDGVYRFNDTAVYRFDVHNDNSASIDISSIAYYGTTTSGKLLAGDVSPVAGAPTVQVRRTSNPFDSPPTWNRASMPPTGPGNARISWSPQGDVVYCGTSQSPSAARDESAFSMSSDDGDNWQQLSLMDTTLRLSDIAPAPDSKTLFVTTYSAFGREGIWRSTLTQAGIGEYWSRQLTMATTSDRVILRLSLNYASDYTIYAAELGGNLIAVSHTRGNSWKWRYAPGAVIDMVVADEDTIYVALSGGFVRQSTNNVWSWMEPVYTGISDINMLAIPQKGTIVVGGRNGEVAYSTDGGASFTRIYDAIGTGDVQVVADANYQKNSLIYASANASDGGIWRWVIGLSTRWEQIDESITTLNTGQRVGGLASGPGGTLYALRQEPVSSNAGGMLRSLNPSTHYPAAIEFNVVNYALPAGITFNPTAVFSHALPHLKLSADSGQNDLWAVDTANEIIYRFQDTLSRLGPTPTSPPNRDIIPVTTRDGGIYPTLSWGELSWVTEYEAAAYLNPDCTQSVWSGNSTTAAIAVTGDNKLPLLGSGATYYWRVRAVKPVKSLWSEIWSFSAALASAWLPLTPLSPAPGSSDVPVRPVFTWNSAGGATGYELVLAANSEFTDAVVAMTGEKALPTTFWRCDRDLDYSTTYFWKVRAISAVSRSDWQTGVFTTVSKPVVEAPPVVALPASPSIEGQPGPALPPSAEVSPPLPSPEPTPLVLPYMLWVAIGLGGALVIVLLVLIVRTGR